MVGMAAFCVFVMILALIDVCAVARPMMPLVVVPGWLNSGQTQEQQYQSSYAEQPGDVVEGKI